MSNTDYDDWMKAAFGVDVGKVLADSGQDESGNENRTQLLFELKNLQDKLNKPVDYRGREQDEARAAEIGRKLGISLPQSGPPQTDSPKTAPAKTVDKKPPAKTEPPAAMPKSIPNATPEQVKLEKAFVSWIQTRATTASLIEQLKNAIRNAFTGEAPKLIADVEKKMSKIDDILIKLDRGLADALVKARDGADAAAKKKGKAEAKAQIAKYTGYVQSQNKLLSYMASNPFGVRMDLKKSIEESLKQASQAIA